MNVVDKRLFTMTKTEHQIYHLQTNGLVEWFNQTLQHCLVKVVNNNQTNWDEKLDGALFAYCTADRNPPESQLLISCIAVPYILYR